MTYPVSLGKFILDYGFLLQCIIHNTIISLNSAFWVWFSALDTCSCVGRFSRFCTFHMYTLVFFVCLALLGKVLSPIPSCSSVFCSGASLLSFLGYNSVNPFYPEVPFNQLLEHHGHNVISSNRNTNILEKFRPLPDYSGGIIIHGF